MRAFEHPNIGADWKCIICGTNTDKPVVLIGITGTEDDGNMQAEQIHLECIELEFNKEHGLLYQRVKE